MNKFSYKIDRVAVSRERLAELVVCADEVRASLEFDNIIISGFVQRAWQGLFKIINIAVVKAAEYLWDSYLVPVMEEAYDDAIEDEYEDWCEEHPPCADPREIPPDTKVELAEEAINETRLKMSRRVFLAAVRTALDALNPVNVIKAAIQSFKRNGFKKGLQVALIIILGDLVIPAMAGIVSPPLFGLLSASPHTEIALAIAVSSKGGVDDVDDWLDEYEEITGQDLVKEYGLRRIHART